MYNRQLRQVVATLTDEQLAIRPSPDRWPIWASIGHLLCQRVCWLCNFAGEPGAEATLFPDALYRCPGDEYLEPAMDTGELVEAIDSTFRIVETVLDSWTIDRLSEEIRQTWGAREMLYTRGSVIQRVFAHDIYHSAELNETLSRIGVPLVNPWD